MDDRVAEDNMREQVALYALGALPEDEARAFEQHIAEGCEKCNAELQAYGLVVAKLGFAAPLQEPPPAARGKLFADLAEEAGGSHPRQAARLGSFTVRLDEGEWIEEAEGLYVKRLFVDEARGTVTTLYRLLPGTQCGGHRHIGVEECIVLEGDFHINDEVLGPGDYHCALPGSVDETIYTVGGTLLLIVAPEKFEPLET